jgi:hypothetical protein
MVEVAAVVVVVVFELVLRDRGAEIGNQLLWEGNVPGVAD